jgi:hypothetical protein
MLELSGLYVSALMIDLYSYTYIPTEPQFIHSFKLSPGLKPGKTFHLEYHTVRLVFVVGTA